MTRRRVWTAERDAFLRQHAALGTPLEEVAGTLGVSYTAVVSRRAAIGLTGIDPVRRSQVWARTVAENEEPWEPLPGMTKRRCLRCTLWFAAREPERELCPDCGEQAAKMKAPSLEPNQQMPTPPTVGPNIPSTTATAPSGLSSGISGPTRTLGTDKVVATAKDFARAAGGGKPA